MALEYDCSPAIRPANRGLCIVVACTDASEAEQIARQLSKPNRGRIITYRRAEDLLHNAPTGTVSLLILASTETTATLERTLKWLRNRWPRCPVTVVGDAGCGDYEIAARAGGAHYLTRPVAAEDWSAIFQHAQKVASDRAQETAQPAPLSPDGW